MLLLSQVKLNCKALAGKADEEVFEALKEKSADILNCDITYIKDISILKRSIDARKKPDIFFSYSLLVDVIEEEKILKKTKSKQISKHIPKTFQIKIESNMVSSMRPVVVGFGPAGIAAAYTLAKLGKKPIIIERGSNVEKRIKDVQAFWDTGKLFENSNVQFGEGGAGAFSDGKLSTGNKDKDGLKRKVLQVLCEHGAGSEILYDAMPHIGTDLLVDIVKNFRLDIIKMGGEFHFDTCFKEFIFDKSGAVKGIVVFTENGSFEIKTDTVILAIGHSARDTFKMLDKTGICIEPKAFAVGYRVAHLQNKINEERYGLGWEDKGLTPSSYKLTYNTGSNRAVYSFCMCPGGYIVNASSKENELCVNGMSYADRGGEYANSAIVMSITPTEIKKLSKESDLCNVDDSLLGMYFQDRIEKNAFSAGEGKIPYSYLKDVSDIISNDLPVNNRKIIKSDSVDNISNSVFKGNIKYVPNMIKDNLILPESLNKDFLNAMNVFSNQISCFNDGDTIIAGIESRTSSPIRILRDESGVALSHKGLYPCGEGAGYAGGIMSAAMDGVRIAISTVKEI